MLFALLQVFVDTVAWAGRPEEVREGGAKGLKIPIKALVRDYYNAVGWDEKTGKPYRQTLEMLGLQDWAKIWH